jgi:indolepyruvate ferredoxin oxidoreductase beta subunit
MPGKFNILIAGVGGQGVLTLGSLIAWASTLSGIDVTVAETHGLSQRGGSLTVHVRLNNNQTPLIPPGEADLLIGLEAIEAARYSYYVGDRGILVVNKLRLPPPLTKPPSLRELEEGLRRVFPGRVYFYDAEKEAKQLAGSALFSNVLLLGYSLGVDGRFRSLLDPARVEEAIQLIFSRKTAEANLRAFKHGLSQGLRVVAGGAGGHPG